MVTTWSSNDALTVPVAALFRQGDVWAVFAICEGRAQVTPIMIGQRNNRVAEVLSGLSAGDRAFSIQATGSRVVSASRSGKRINPFTSKRGRIHSELRSLNRFVIINAAVGITIHCRSGDSPTRNPNTVTTGIRSE